MKSILLAGLLAFLVCGCEHTYHTQLSMPVTKLKGPGATAYIVQPLDASYKGEVYAGSGEKTAAMLQNAFGRYVDQTAKSNGPEKLEHAMESAAQRRFTYLVFPTVLQWEDHATEWSGHSDLLALDVQVFDVAGRNVVNRAVITGKSKWATMGGDHPEHLIPVPLNGYVSQMFSDTIIDPKGAENAKAK